MPQANPDSVAISIPIAPVLPKSHRLKRREQNNSKVFGQIGGFIFIVMLLVMFVAVHSRHNEMVYVALLFVFLAIALFTYGFWRAVSRGEGVWQYVGKHNLQHQQVSNPHNHFRSVPNFKDHPKSQMHLVAPPKMGGCRLEIYTLAEDEQLRKTSVASSEGHHSRQHSHCHHHHHHSHRHRHQENYAHRLYHQQQHEKLVNQLLLQPDLQHRPDSACPSFVSYDSNGSLTTCQAQLSPEMNSHTMPLLRPGQSCMDLPVLSDGADHESEPIKVEVNLSRSASHQHRRRQREGFEEVQLPALKQQQQQQQDAV